MKEYPKVPRYGLSIVEDDWFTEDVKIIEKYDGSNFRFGIYDERYGEYYEELDGENGDWLIGTSSVPRHESDVDDFDKSLKIDDRLEYLKENVSKHKLLDIHSRYNSPITVFCENMVRHTISYDKGIPPLIMFDVYVPRYDDSETISSHPYNQEFSGFVDWEEVVEISTKLGLVHARHIDTGISREDVHPDMIGESEYAEGKTAEGYIIRNDEYNRRIKVRSPEFLEMNKKIWGNVVDNNDPIEKQIAYKYATTNRIRKKVIESLRERELNGDTLDFIVSITVDDIWMEEWSEITRKKFNPFDLYSYVAERIKGTLSRPNLFSIPDKTEDVVKSWKFNSKSEYIPQRTRPDNPENYILRMITNDVLRELSDKIVDESDKEEGNWVIEPLTRNLRGWLFNENLDSIKCIDKVVDFQSVTEQLYDITVPYIKTRYS